MENILQRQLPLPISKVKAQITRKQLTFAAIGHTARAVFRDKQSENPTIPQYHFNTCTYVTTNRLKVCAYDQTFDKRIVH